MRPIYAARPRAGLIWITKNRMVGFQHGENPVTAAPALHTIFGMSLHAIATGTPRRRLPATTRHAQIVDAALQVFADKGYAAARIDDIAAAAGLSKGGIYTHFKSKEEIFEALLTRVLQPPRPAEVPRPEDLQVTPQVLVLRVIDPLYDRVAQPEVLAVLRLLLAEGEQAPQAVGRWMAAAIDPCHAELEALVRTGVAQGLLHDGVPARAPRLLLAPLMHFLFDLLIQGDAVRDQGAQRRALHGAWVREQMAPR